MKKKSMLQTLFMMALVEVLLLQPFAVPTAISASNPTAKGKVSWETEWNTAVDAAKREGKVFIYSTPGGDVLRALANVFEKKYGVKIEWIIGRGEELARRMQAEKVAGINACDVILSGGGTSQTVMKPRGLLGKLNSLLILPEVIDPQAWTTKRIPYMDKDQTAIALSAVFQRYIIRNTAMVRENEITSYKDLLNPKWKGKITINDPTVAGTASTFFTMLALDVWGIEETKVFMRQLVKQEPAITRDRRLQAEWIAKGKYALSVATNTENAIDFIKLGAPIDTVKVKEGGFATPGAGGLSVPLSPAHPNASKVFINWLLTKEGHSVFVKAYGSPGVRVDAPREGIPVQLYADADEKVYQDNEESILYRGDQMMKIAQEIFAPLLK